MELVRSKINKLNSSLFRYKDNGENKVKILKKIRDIFSTPSNEFNQKQKRLLSIKNDDLWDRSRISIREEINKIVLEEKSVGKKIDRSVDKIVHMAISKGLSPELIGMLTGLVICSPFIAIIIYQVYNKNSISSDTLKTKDFWVRQNITFRKLKNIALSNRPGTILLFPT